MERGLRILVIGACLLMRLTAAWAQLPVRPQPVQCTTPDLTEAQKRSLSREAAMALRVKRSMSSGQPGITWVPIKPHIFRRSNGTGGLNLNKLNNILAITNRYYLQNGSGIQFYFCGTSPDYINNDGLYNNFPAFNENAVEGRDAVNAMNQYYVNAFNQSGLGGYAYFPENRLGATRSFILNEADEEDLANRLLPHELGHNFGLFHTFGNTNNGTTELVTRGADANCATAGDELCDTPADPYGLPRTQTANLDGCETYIGTATDAQGNLFAPSVTNIMSYYYPCTHDFTPGQYERMQAGLALRQSHTAYSLDCPPTAVDAPTQLMASLSNGHIRLTWQDNATNEMGYFIERSTLPDAGFVPIGGVGPNSTAFTDVQTAGLTSYYYRIRPSNAAASGLSSVVNITSGPCRPIYGLSHCTFGDGLSGFVINSTTLSQNTGCSTGGYGIVTGATVSISPGRPFTFTGSLAPAGFPQGVTIWADMNRNGVYEADQNELLYQSTAPIVGTFSGTITLPASLSLGALPVRVITAFGKAPLDPCGRYKYGETEDYVLQVVSPPVADLSVSMQVSSRTPALGKVVSYSLVVHNDGPDPATGIRWQSRLPASMSFVEGSTGVVSSASVVSNTNSFTLDAGSSRSFWFRLQPNRRGRYRNAVQLIAVEQDDPDSQPNSGTGDGQDDAVMADIRTIPDSAALFASPNPGQVPLPAVVSNQPPSHPAKADLSLVMAASRLVTQVGQSLSLVITVHNAGGLAASNVVVRDTLRGLTLVSATPNVTVVSSTAAYTIVQCTDLTVPVGQSTTLTLVVTPTAVGTVRNTAQVWSSDQPDPDSRPGAATPLAGNLNGEDDMATVELRVRK